MTVWLTMFAVGLFTFATRLSFILLFGRWQVPAGLRRALHYIPPAVLSAIVLPELMMPDGDFDLSLSNYRLLAGALAILVAWRTRNVLLTLLAGIAAILALQTI